MAPEGVYHYSEKYEVPHHLVKYWLQRHKIFSKFDEGVWLTDDAWFGVTPEPVAHKIAQQMATADSSKRVIIDAFAGAGGNAIQFALSGRWDHVFAVEKDATVLACARHNAELYGVDDKIYWIHDDVFETLTECFEGVASEAIVFASPPWGGRSSRSPDENIVTDWQPGPNYVGQNPFDLESMQPYSLGYLYDQFSRFGSDFVLYLPRTSDMNQLATYRKKEKIPVVHYCMHGASKAIGVFFHLDETQGGLNISGPVPTANDASNSTPEGEGPAWSGSGCDDK